MRRPSAVTVFTVVGTVLMSLGFALFFTTPTTITLADDPQETTPFEDHECLNCHTDKDRLQELAPAVEEEEESALSSGPG